MFVNQNVRINFISNHNMVVKASKVLESNKALREFINMPEHLSAGADSIPKSIGLGDPLFILLPLTLSLLS